jgi:hypothetical protein
MPTPTLKGNDLFDEYLKAKSGRQYNSQNGTQRDDLKLDDTISLPNRTRNNKDSTGNLLGPDYFGLLKTNGIGTITVSDEYGNMSRVNLITVEEEKRRMTNAMNKKHNMYTYYSIVWGMCAVAFGVFVTSGVSGLLGPLTSIAGSLISAAGIVGGIVDWKDWVKKNAF